MSAAIDLDGATSRDHVDFDYALHVDPGSHVVVAGPNGSGKSTLLRVLAGLTPLASGRLCLDGAVVDDPARATFLPPDRRSLVLQPQRGALFDHLSVLDNVAFAPRANGMSRRRARHHVRPWLEKLRLDELAQRRPSTLSGGQRSRVALARSLAAEPAVLLLDEPAAALDAVARADLRHLLADLTQTVLTVTHDPLEARLLGSSIAVVDNGRIAQHGTADEIAERPSSPWVAEMLGVNLLSGTAAGGSVELADGASVTLAEPAFGPVHVAFPATAVVITKQPPTGSARNVWRVTVTGLTEDLGRVRLALGGPFDATAVVTTEAAAELDLRPGAECHASVKATELTVLPG